MAATVRTMSAEAGQQLADFCAEMVAAAWVQNCFVMGEFNSHTLIARPGMTRGDLVAQWELQIARDGSNRA